MQAPPPPLPTQRSLALALLRGVTSPPITSTDDDIITITIITIATTIVIVNTVTVGL
jgi:hypothetical protein